MGRSVRHFPSLEKMSLRAAELVVERAKAATSSRGRFALALAGGGTPRTLYEILAKEPFSSKMDWKSTHLFWSDERCVGPADPRSNFRMAREALIDRVPVPKENVHRIPAEMMPCRAAADAYDAELKGFFGPRAAFDLVILGVGPDGHTASLFPGHRALSEEARWVVAIEEPQGTPSLPRITLSLPALNQARCALFLASILGKEEVLSAILDSPHEAAGLYPAAMVRPIGELIWLIDESLP